MNYPGDFAQLSIEQLKDLIAEVGPLPGVMRELQIRGLMERIEGLTRGLAILLVNPIAEGAAIEEQAKLLRALFVRNRLTDVELAEIGMSCHDEARRLWRRAITLYTADPSRTAVNDALAEVLLGAYQRQQEAEAAGGGYADDQAMKDAAAATAEYEERLRMREFFRDHLGIESAADLRMWIEAMGIIHKRYRNDWDKADRQMYRGLVGKASKLFQEARAMNCTPRRLADWQDIQRKGGMDENTIYKRPDGVEVWGDMSPVLRGADGAPRRGMAGFLGRTVAEGSVPTDVELQNMAKTAWPDEEFPEGWSPAM
ncbi:hypothetical protein [Synechococcus sp. CBW1107]|uniref:hypothetical protein n=1 Tax=Synechococcus sp. CBW1107 TaxID=2789857 RepID=UPI002AD480F5|nr:hypothetical protein [Synechococcus sp. CBW1107]CAK6697961.1 hypothetical protein MNNICLKF_02351 [Synechococcus sp. CBW1107]